MIDEMTLEQLEEAIATGKRASLRRNAVVAQLHREGERKVDLLHRVNAARVAVGEKPVGFAAVSQMISRA